MGQVLSNLISIVCGRKQRVDTSDEENVYHAPDDHCERVKSIHPTSGYGKTRVSEEDEGSVVIVITDADQVREDVAEPFPLVSGDPNTRLSEDELVTIIVDSGVKDLEKIKPVTDTEVRVDAEPFPLLSVDTKPRVLEDEKAKEDVADPFPVISGDPETRVSEDERVMTIIVDRGVKAVEEIKPIHHVSTGKTRVSEEDEGSVVIVITDADQVREDLAEPFPLVSGDPNTRLSEDEWATIIVDSGVRAVEKIIPVTDTEVRVDAEPFPLLSVDPKTRVSEDVEPFVVSVDTKPGVLEGEKVREDVADPFSVISGDQETRVSEDERVMTIIVDRGVKAVEKIKLIHHVSTGGAKITVPKDGSGAKRKKRRAKRKERRIKHYNSSHKILLVGEGDFSFSACLAKVFCSANNMVATSLNSVGFLEENYSNAMSNINGLKSRGCMVLHRVDATNMSGHQLLKSMKFDRIIFNFPYAGFFKNEPRESQKSRHQKLVTLFFKNAKKMLSNEGEIHISHKSNGFHCEWNIISLASLSGLNLIKKEKFNLNDYSGYNTKRGFGGDENFDCNPSETYMFGLK